MHPKVGSPVTQAAAPPDFVSQSHHHLCSASSMVNFADFLQRLFASSAPSDGGGGGNGNDGEKQDGEENTGTTASYVNHDHEIAFGGY